MGFDDLFKILGSHHGGHQGGHHGRRYDDHDIHNQGHGGHNYGYPNSCGSNGPSQGGPNPAARERACPKCAGPVPVCSKFCPSCGVSLESAACKGCGVKLPAAAAFCPDCGAKV